MTDNNRKRILASLDGSSAALDTVAYLAHMLPPKESEIVLLTITTATPESFWDIEGEPDQAFSDLWKKHRQKALEKFSEKSRQIFFDAGFDEKNIIVKIKERVSGIARDIIKESGQNYDAAVIGRIGMNPITRVVVGSVANKLAESITHLPLCIVGKNVKNRKILLAMDASEGAMRCVKFAGEMFGKTDAEFLLFHVIRDYDFKLSEIPDQSDIDIEESGWLKITQSEIKKASQTIKSVMDKGIHQLESFGISRNRINTKILTGMATRGGSIVAQAMLAGYSTIVIGRKGLSKVGDFNMGRVCYKVVQLGNEVAVWIVN